MLPRRHPRGSTVKVWIADERGMEEGGKGGRKGREGGRRKGERPRVWRGGRRQVRGWFSVCRDGWRADGESDGGNGGDGSAIFVSLWRSRRTAASRRRTPCRRRRWRRRLGQRRTGRRSEHRSALRAALSRRRTPRGVRTGRCGASHAWCSGVAYRTVRLFR